MEGLAELLKDQCAVEGLYARYAGAPGLAIELLLAVNICKRPKHNTSFLCFHSRPITNLLGTFALQLLTCVSATLGPCNPALPQRVSTTGRAES